ncbi:16S rRNA (guanine(527)-N(7))-methyltransferase RsmG [Peptoniphilus sp. KCTC 25270]|uniref:16S rRNA (guanine(527)-N(7))-methyltransferase RsmG n=1 Tax=Peptoniphilus sp. KCTC 25270 TaxID=2897414 RepID=UPI001E41D691|nr:16S rRNA (guanine(527)-N(7))-methyltransferase RsmG [Peptoniphilus sp. KCTC 25270]MCD1147903.1 16S rRNA (guanine(527)-N(7))-methyltransferase RsmG [Peptoniphilus sp. KCTC 25270]
MNWERLDEGLKKHNIQKDIPYSAFDIYTKLLLEWNEKMNLTRITEPEEIQIKHFLDSLTPFLLPFIEEGSKVIDLGTGAGFPGVPMALVEPNLEMTLMDSLGKRIKFLQEVIDTLEMENTVAIHGRAEEMARKPEYREQYDICISRAVARLNVLAEYCLPFVKVGGYFIAMKAEDAKAEVKEAKKSIEILGGEIIEELEFELFDGETRNIIVVQKIKETKSTYPRGGGKPRKNPL